MAPEGCRPETLRSILSDSLPLSVSQCYRYSSYRLIGFRALIFPMFSGKDRKGKEVSGLSRLCKVVAADFA